MFEKKKNVLISEFGTELMKTNTFLEYCTVNIRYLMKCRSYIHLLENRKNIIMYCGIILSVHMV